MWGRRPLLKRYYTVVAPLKGRLSIVPIAGIVPAKWLGTILPRYTVNSTSIGPIPNSAGVRYTAGIVGWRTPAR